MIQKKAKQNVPNKYKCLLRCIEYIARGSCVAEGSEVFIGYITWFRMVPLHWMANHRPAFSRWIPNLEICKEQIVDMLINTMGALIFDFSI